MAMEHVIQNHYLMTIYMPFTATDYFILYPEEKRLFNSLKQMKL